MSGRNVAAALSVIAVAPLAASSDDGLSAFLGGRSRLFSIAYRMLANVAEAEDIVQDVCGSVADHRSQPGPESAGVPRRRDHATRDQRAPLSSLTALIGRPTHQPKRRLNH
jgi:hypothetical protein